MNRQICKSTGIILLLAAALFTFLFASSVISPPDSSAHPCDPAKIDDMHEDFNRTVLECGESGHQGIHQNVIEVDGGRDRELKFKVYPPPNDRDSYLGAGDQIEITLPEFDLSRTDSSELETRILIAGSKDGDDSQTPEAPVEVGVNSDKLILTLPELSSPPRFEEGEYLEITINRSSGILTPETPRGFDESNDGYEVTITFIDRDAGENRKNNFAATDRNTVVVKNPISSTVPSATVRVELATHAEVVIGSSEEIVVDFSGPSADSEFIVPSSIATSRITIVPDGLSPFNPSEVQVQGSKVTLTIPAGTNPKAVRAGDYTLTFTNSAGIRNPFSAGNRVITVQSFAEGDDLDEITAVIRRTTTIAPLEGPRGSEFTLEGKGYAKGTVTIYEGDDDIIGPGETLASVETVRGAFKVELIARGKKDDLVYTVRAKDSEGVDAVARFLIKSAISFEPAPARVGSPVRITISDWQDLHQEVIAVRIAGRDAYDIEVIEYEECFEYPDAQFANSDRVVSFKVQVPQHVPPGEQTVALYDHEQLDHFRVIDGVRNVVEDKGACADLPEGEDRGSPVSSNVKAALKAEPIAITKDTLEIETQDLQLSPSSAARGQKVTITGSGFARSLRGIDHIESVWIGGTRVVDDHSQFEVGTAGDFVLTITVPLAVQDGPNEVLIEGGDHTIGKGTLTIPEAAIELTPAHSQRGTEFTVTGSGFIANEAVLIAYTPDEGASEEAAQSRIAGVVADSQGYFELSLTVPVAAEVGMSYRVTAVAKADVRGDAVSVDAEASHLVTRAIITTSPELVSPGDYLTILGEHFPTFSPVGTIRVGGIGVVPRTEVATDEEGSFEVEVLVPHIDFGDQTLMVEVAGVIVPHTIRSVAPPLSGPPEQVFKNLIRARVLLVVWSYDNVTQDWNLFAPTISEDAAELNDLKSVESGDIVWVNLQHAHYFQGDNLGAGWSLIVLD